MITRRPSWRKNSGMWIQLIVKPVEATPCSGLNVFFQVRTWLFYWEKILFISKNEICKILFLIRCKWNWCLMESMPTPQVHWATKQGNTMIMLWKKLGYYTCIKHLINAVIGQLTEISFVYILEWYVGDLICTLLIYRHYLFIMCNTIYNVILYCIILSYIALYYTIKYYIIICSQSEG